MAATESPPLFASNLLAFVHPGPIRRWRYDVSADGQRILMQVNPRSTTFAASSSSPMVVVSNWAASLKKDLPPAR